MVRATQRDETLTAMRATNTDGNACYRSLVGPVDAIYENGLLRPVSLLPLRSGERVAVIVVRRADAARWDTARLSAHGDEDLALAEAGLDEWAAALSHGRVEPVTEAE